MVYSADNCKTYNLLHSAAILGNINLCKLLITKGTCVNKVDNRDKTPIFVAAKRGHADVCNLLESHGADIFSYGKRNLVTFRY